VLRALRDGKRFLAARDLVVSPTYVPDLVHTVLDLLIDGAYGIWHLTSGEPVSWAELAMRAADVAKLSPTSLVSCSSADLDWVARRPRYSALMSNRSSLMPSLASSLARYMASAAQPLLPLAIE
jgi:dTDP-4-dehydrorhamnose reductase